MAAVVSLFFDNMLALVGADEAPKRILETERFASNYRAVLKKRFGHITADDFLKYARRFAVLCNGIYRGSRFEFLKNRSVPLGFAVFAASQGAWEGNPGEELDISKLTTDAFREIFTHASSMVFNIRPRVSREDIRSSFVQVAWTRGRPRTIFFYAQQGGRYDLNGSQRPLENLLLRKMFYVSGVPPSFNFAVNLGVRAYLNEAEGKLF